MKRITVRKVMFWLTFGAGVAALLAVASCTRSSTSSAPSTLSITAPRSGATVPAGNVTVSVQVSNLSLVDKIGKSSAKGEGHIVYAMDVQPSTTAGKSALPTAGRWQATAATSYTFTNVPAGTHRFYVQLVNNNNTPLTPAVSADVSVTVEAPPAPTPVPPAEVPAPTPVQTPSEVQTPSSIPSGE